MHFKDDTNIKIQVYNEWVLICVVSKSNWMTYMFEHNTKGTVHKHLLGSNANKNIGKIFRAPCHTSKSLGPSFCP